MELYNCMTIDKAKSALKMKISEYEMLNKTLLEMYEKDTSEIVIDTLKDEINETLDSIEGIRTWIETETDKGEKAEYSFYDGIKKPKLAKSVKLASFGNSSNGRRYDSEVFKKSFDNFYDSIKKKEEKDINNLSNFKPYDTPYNHLNYEDAYVGKLKFLNSETDKKSLNETITTTNHFLVRFNGALNIKEWLVKSVDFGASYRKELFITIQDHIAVKEDGTKYPIISEINSKTNDLYNTFPISVDYLDETGRVIYTERYHNCTITEVTKSSLSYETEGFNTIQMKISFKDVTYETSH